MEKKPVGKRGRARPLSEDERKLWQLATRDALPLPLAARAAPAEHKIPAEISSPPPSAHWIERPVAPAPTLAAPPPLKRSMPPPLTGIDRRTSQRLGRGQIEYEAKLDLHGFTRENAYGSLRRFLTDRRRAGLRCVLVVTGKGDSPYSRHTLHGTKHYDAPERQGVLRAALPQWLEEPEFRALVAGFQPAHPKHGGGGAFYVLLRRRR